MTSHPSAALRGVTLTGATPLGTRRAAFLGCGDSLAAARPAEWLGHRAMSAGDVAWSGQPPAGVDVVVALSWSGRTGATIAAARVGREAGLPLIAVTADGASPLAAMADECVVLPRIDAAETIPSLGYAIHSAALAEMCTGTSLDLDDMAERWHRRSQDVEHRVESWGVAPQGISVVTMPDVHGAGEFWMLKLIEATGIAVRWVAVEEVGHVDYFIGAQAHLDLLLSGGTDPGRLLSLGEALARNGHLTQHIAFDGDSGWSRHVLAGVLGADYAAALAHRWGRPPFRGGIVDMSAAHIHVSNVSPNLR